MKAKIAKTILSLAEYYDKTLSAGQLEMFVDDLEGLNADQLAEAVKKYRRNPANVFFPLPAKLIELVSEQDGRPGVEEAWSMMPKDERTSIVWTDEMQQAYSSVHHLLQHDSIAARMAFKEKYSQLLRDARSKGKPAKWNPSFGYDVSGRETAIKVAIEKNRLTHQAAQDFLPELAPLELPIGIAGPDLGADVLDIKSLIAKTIKTLEHKE